MLTNYVDEELMTRQSESFDELLRLMKLEQLEDNLFRGASRDIGTERVFGGQVLGQAGPCQVRGLGYLPSVGMMEFDSDDLDALEASGRLLSVVLHEMGHVLGIGTWWTTNSVYVDGTGTYTGVNGLAAWKAEMVG